MAFTVGYLIVRENRELFMRELPEWAELDPEYHVIELIAKSDSQTSLLIECEESRQLLMDLYELQEIEIAALRERLKGLE